MPASQPTYDAAIPACHHNLPMTLPSCTRADPVIQLASVSCLHAWCSRGIIFSVTEAGAAQTILCPGQSYKVVVRVGHMMRAQ